MEAEAPVEAAAATEEATAAAAAPADEAAAPAEEKKPSAAGEEMVDRRLSDRLDVVDGTVRENNEIGHPSPPLQQSG